MNIFEDLAAECASLDDLVSGLSAAEWALPTPAEGWTIAHQIAHLAWTDRCAVTAATDPEAFEAFLRDVSDPTALVESGADPSSFGDKGPLPAWRQSRAALVTALRAVTPGTRVPWFGPPMAAPSMATARLMETWAHGQDVADALSVARQPTERIRHVAHIAVRARDYAYTANGLPAPEEPFYVSLTGPDGENWTWGPSMAAQRVTGPALDFCLLAVQRRHRSDLSLTTTGPEADRWLDIAQAFAGPPGSGRSPAAALSERSSTR